MKAWRINVRAFLENKTAIVNKTAVWEKEDEHKSRAGCGITEFLVSHKQHQKVP